MVYKRYRVLVDGDEKTITKSLSDNSRYTDNLTREEIINHYLNDENASEILIAEAVDKEESGWIIT